MNIEIICVGKLKRSFYNEACDYYIKRIKPYLSLSIHEIAECSPHGDGEKDIINSLNKEAAVINKYLEKRTGVISVALCVEGNGISSDAFAKHITESKYSGVSCIRYIIGGSYGLADCIKHMADLCLSISEMTFTHAIARVLLLEQIYRAVMIENGSKYHK